MSGMATLYSLFVLIYMRRNPQYHFYELTLVVLEDWDPGPHIHIIFLKVFSYFNHFEIYLRILFACS